MSGGPRSGGRHVGHVVCSVCRCHAACACAHRHRTAIAAAIRFASQNRPHEVYGPESDIRGRRPQPHGQRSCSSRICGGCGCVSCVWSSERVCAGLWIVRSRLHTRGHCALLCGVPPEPFRGAGSVDSADCARGARSPPGVTSRPSRGVAGTSARGRGPAGHRRAARVKTPGRVTTVLKPRTAWDLVVPLPARVLRFPLIGSTIQATVRSLVSSNE